MAPTGLKKVLSFFEAVRLALQERVQQRLPLGLRAADGGSVDQVESSGELSSRSSTTSPRSSCLLGPEQTTRPAPTVQQSQGLLVKVGFGGSESEVEGRVVKLGLLGLEQMARPAPALQQWQKL